MKLTTITRWEFKNTLKSRKFLLIFFLQISVLFMMLMVFNSFAANLESNEALSITPSLSGFANLDVNDQGGLFSKRLNSEVLNIQNSTYDQALDRLESGLTTGYYAVPPESVALVQKGDTVETVLYLDYRDPKRSVVLEEVNSTTKLLSSALTTSYLESARPSNVTNSPGVKETTSGESVPLQIIRKVMLSVLLFLPLFLFGNLIIDSLVGEKERKTGEILMAMPLTSTDIIIGKSMAVVMIIALQVGMWMIILLGAGFPLKNPGIVYLIVVLTAIPLVGLTTIIAAYSKNYKEAGIGLTFAYIFISGLLIVPLLGYISRQSVAANISPMTLVMRIFSGESIAPGEILLSLTFIVIISLISYGISIALFRRDDVVFGPRPGILRLTLELLGLKKS
ncbi:MAG: ABC transporter permease [Methanobacteriaceae archaeon]